MMDPGLIPGASENVTSRVPHLRIVKKNAGNINLIDWFTLAYVSLASF